VIDLPLSQSGKTALQVATEAAKAAGQVLLSNFHSRKKTKSKGRGNLVSEVDFLSQDTILKLLRYEYPDFGVVSEETDSPTTVSGYTWIVDPLDGTNNYVFGIPFFCVNVTLVKDSGILTGVTYDPSRNELFYAQKNEGAYLNNRRIRVSDKALLKTSLIGLDLGYDTARGRELLDIIAKLLPHVHAVRLMGSASLGLAYVACGRIDLYLHRFIFPWDIATGILLVVEAGGVINDWQGKPATFESQGVIAANKTLNNNFGIEFLSRVIDRL